MNDDTSFRPSRRHFVGTLAAGLGGLAATAAAAQSLPTTPAGRPQPKLETPPTGPEAQKLGWAVVGLGDFAQGHMLPALNRASLSRPTGLVSGNPEKLKVVGARYAIPEASRYSYDTMGRMRDDAAIDVAYVITPNGTHAELVVKAFEAGKHVFCEKPMANSPAECQRMIDAAKAADRRLAIGYRAHFEPLNVKAKEMLDRGELGDVWFAASDHHRPLDPSLPRDEWRAKKALSGGGSFVDIGIYSLNGLLWYFGENPVRVSATTFSPPGDERFKEVEANLAAELVFPSGRRANISSGYIADKKRIDLWGSKAVAVLDPATAYSGNALRVSKKDGTLDVQVAEPSEVQFEREMDAFSRAIREGSDIMTPGEMGLRDVRIIEALYKSAETGRWVELNPDMTMKG